MVLEITANLNGGDLVTPDNELTYKIYGSADNYASPIANLGSAVNDAKVSVLNGVVTIINVDVGNETSFKISSIDAAGNEAVLSDTSDTPFIIEIDSTESGVSNTDQFQFTGAEGDYDVVAKQNGVVIETFNNLSDESTITFATSGIYDLEVMPKDSNGFNIIRFGGGGDKDKMLDIKQWGTIKWDSLIQAYFRCRNMKITATDVPDFSICTNFALAFYDCGVANPDTTNWDMSTATNTKFMFRECLVFNGDVSNWDMSNVTAMNDMFSSCTLFNSDCSDWDVSQVTDMESMYKNSGLSPANLTLIYENWSQLNLQQNVEFSAGTTKYNASGQAGRDILVNTYNWIIEDGGQV